MPFTSAYLKILGSIDLYQPHKNVNYVQIVKVHAFPFTAFLYVNGSMAIYTGILPRGTIWYTHFSFQQNRSNKHFPSLTCTYDNKCTQKLKENIAVRAKFI